MTPEERLEKLETYGRAYELLVDALNQIPREMWLFKPAADGWSIHEIVVHIADSEANSYIRFRKCLCEPGQSLTAYDEPLWAETLRYSEQSPDEALELFKWLRMSTYQVLRGIPETAWTNTIDHPESGLITLEDLLHTYERHIPEHIEQMWAAYAAWMKL
jgi:hypothetical protein